MNMTLAFALFALLGLVLILSVSVSYSATVQDGSDVFSETATITGDAKHLANPVSIPAAQAATLTTRTDDDTGSLTMTSGSHGIVTGQRVDLYWTGGRAYGALVGTVAGSVVPITSTAGGTVLPAADTAIKVGICTEAEMSFDGSKVQSMVLSTPAGSNAYFVWNETTTNRAPVYLPGGRISTWKTGDAAVNPLLAFTAITSIWMSHDNTSGPITTMKANIVTQST